VWSGKNKLFFFTDLEWTKRRQFATRTVSAINPAGIFDAAGNANLSAAILAGTDCNVTRVAGCVYDPNTGNANGTGRLAFPGNIIPANRIDPAAKLMLGRINPAGFINNLGVTANNNYISAGSASLDRRTFDLKINYVPNAKTTIFGRYSRSNALLFDPPTLGDAMGGAIFDLLHPFEPGLLIEGEVPEDTWTRVARHWHECYRLSHPVPPGHPKASARVPWSGLDSFLKQDNILELRSILSAVAARGRQWAPVHLVPGIFVFSCVGRHDSLLAANYVTRSAPANNPWQLERLPAVVARKFRVRW